MSKQKYPQNTTTNAGGTTARRIKTEGYSSAALQAKRDRKRAEAEARQRSYNALTFDEKLEQIEDRRGASARELARVTQVPRTV